MSWSRCDSSEIVRCQYFAVATDLRCLADVSEVLFLTLALSKQA